jgi:hypothetical protein
VTAAQLRIHAHELARAFKARLVETPGMPPDDAFAIPAMSVVVCAPITEETTYAVALHELGHLVAPLGALRTRASAHNVNLRCDEEEAAWAWARRMAIEWTPVMESVARWAEGTYTRVADEERSVMRPGQIKWEDWK